MMPVFCHAQKACIDTSYKKLYNSPDAILINNYYTINDKDTGLLCGKVIDFSANDTAMYVSKIDPESNVVWAKKIKFKSYTNYQTPDKIVELPNGDMVLLFFIHNDTAVNLLKLKNDGSFAWAKSISGMNEEYFNTCNLFSDQNDLYISCASIPDIGSDAGNFRNSIINLDNDGNIIWSRYYRQNYECFNATPVGLLVNNGSLIVFGRLWAAGCKDPTIGFPDRERTYFGMKVNKFSGALGKSVSYTSPRELAPNGSPGAYTYNFTNTGNNNLFFSTRFYNLSNHKYGSYKVHFDSNLNIYYGYLYYHTNTALPTLSSLNVDRYGNTSILFYNDAMNQYVGKFDAANNIIREKRLSAPLNMQSYNSLKYPFATKRNYMNLVTNFKNNTAGYVQLVQLSNEEQNSECFGEDTNFIKIEPFTVTPYSSPFFDGDFELALSIKNTDVAVSPLNIIKEDDCEKIFTCNKIELTGEDTVCNLNQVFTYKSHLNGGCDKSVFWQIDSSTVQSLNIIDDTTVQIQFKKSWSGYLYASINSCSVLIDSIKIEVLPSPASVDFGKDTTLCTGNELMLNAKRGFKNYIWQDGSTDSVFTATQPGKYFVTANDYCNNIYTDTIQILYETPAPIDIGKDTSICDNQVLLLNAGDNFIKYLWSNGDTTQYTSVNNKGEYWISAINKYGCISKDSIKILNVFPSPVIHLNKQNILCLNQNNTINAGSGFATYSWNNGKTDSSIVVTSPGIYKVVVSNSYNCFTSDGVEILGVKTPPTNFLNSADSICDGDTIRVYPNKTFDEYLWSTGSTNSSIQINQSGVYWLKVKDDNSCISSDTIHIFYKDCDAYFFIPNAFTPNRDGLNDFFKPVIKGNIEQYEFAIYNRFGQLVFKTQSTNQSWDGTQKGVASNSGIYIWTCHYKIKNETGKFLKGQVLLIR